MPTRAILPEVKLSSTNDCSYKEEGEEEGKEKIQSYTQTTTLTNIKLTDRTRSPPYLVSRNVTDHVVRTVKRIGQGVFVCCLV